MKFARENLFILRKDTIFHNLWQKSEKNDTYSDLFLFFTDFFLYYVSVLCYNQKMIVNKTGVAVPLSALRTESSPVVGEFISLIEFADFASKSGLSVIQLLPVLDTGMQSSPYSSLSAFALHPMYIHIESLDEFKICYEKDAAFKKCYESYLQHKKDERFDYEFIVTTKDFLLRKIFSLLVHSASEKNAVNMRKKLSAFIAEHNDWLPSYCVYKYLKYKFMQASWKEWDKSFQKLSKERILELWNDKNLEQDMLFYAWEQIIAFKQFGEASAYIRSLGIVLKGDLPILLNEDSCDVWSCPEVFNQKLKAGSPPDGENPTGQNWGFPCYDFVSQEKDNFAWWRLRIRLASLFFDAYRLDHIPGFFRLWTIPDGESTAEMGHTEPFAPISESQLLKAGFSKERIRWLSQPHLPTEDFIRLIGNPDTTREILGLLCDRIGWEELWLFKPSIKTEADIRKINLDKYGIDKSIQVEIFNRLTSWWKNRTLIEVSKNKFAPLWKYYESRAWNSLSQVEKDVLGRIFSETNQKQEALWETQSKKIFSALISESKMTPCGEDLGVYIPCMERVLDEYGICGLKVIRWCRKWEKSNQPFISLRSYRKYSIVTTSVHDSSTMREWYDEEIRRIGRAADSIGPNQFFEQADIDSFGIDLSTVHFTQSLEPKTAQLLFETFAKTSGAWFINPVQDWMYLDSKYYAADSKSERINVPGSVSNFNWTWRMPVDVKQLLEDTGLSEKIKRIAEIHDSIGAF